MLTELHLENFKAWRELTIEFGRITALFGENSSGKRVETVDSDWAEQRTLTDDLGVDVVQLCPKHATRAGA